MDPHNDKRVQHIPMNLLPKDVIIHQLKETSARAQKLEDIAAGAIEERDNERKTRKRLEKAIAEFEEGCAAIGKWMSAAQDDPKVCDEMKADINTFFSKTASAHCQQERPKLGDILYQAIKFPEEVDDAGSTSKGD